MLIPGALAPLWIRSVFEAAGAQQHALTVDRSASLEAWWASLLVCGTFVVTLLLVNRRRQLRWMLWTLVWVGVVTAVISGITVMEGAHIELFGISPATSSIASGPFVNRNHFANYLVLTLCAGIGLLISMQDRRRAQNWRQRLVFWAETLLGPKARLRIFLALMVITLVLTRSRMGNTAFFISLLVAGSIALSLIRGRQRPLMILIASLVAIDIFIVGTWFGVEQVVDRIQKTVTVTEQQVIIHAQARLEANREALEIIKVAPLAGMGAGTWFTVFPRWRAYDHGFFDHAHNDYLEFAVEFGVPVTVLLGAFVLLCAWRALCQLARRRDPLVLGASFACGMAIIAMGIHASVDFSLHIPANAATFMVLLALPWLNSVARGNRSL